MKQRKFYYYEMPAGSGILWGSEDPNLAYQIGKGIALWRFVTVGDVKPKKKRRKQKR